MSGHTRGSAILWIMRILVTGAAGFIGAHVVTELLDHGHEVVALDGLVPPVHATPVWPTWLDARAQWQHADLRDPDSVDAALDGVTAVVHQAALVGHGLDLQDLPAYASLTDVGTAELLAAMARHRVQNLVLASSMVVYGEGQYACKEHGTALAPKRLTQDLAAGRFDPRCPRCQEPLQWTRVSESAPKDPQSVYATSKLAQEHYAAAWARGVSGRAIFLRYHNVYGPRMPMNSPYSGVAALFRSALETNQSPQVFEDGEQMRDFVHVTDVARANRLALENLAVAGPDGLALNICSGRPRSIGWAAQLMAKELQGPAPTTTGEFRAADVRHVVADPTAAGQQIGFTAAVDPAEGFAEFVRAPMRK